MNARELVNTMSNKQVLDILKGGGLVARAHAALSAALGEASQLQEQGAWSSMDAKRMDIVVACRVAESLGLDITHELSGGSPKPVQSISFENWWAALLAVSDEEGYAVNKRHHEAYRINYGAGMSPRKALEENSIAD